MTRTMLSSLAAAAILAMLAGGAANAEQSRKPKPLEFYLSDVLITAATAGKKGRRLAKDAGCAIPMLYQ